jgi:hypothetical protein
MKNTKITTTKANKGKPIVTLTQEEYERRVNNFIKDNKFIVINNNTTQHYQKNLKQTLK